MSRYINADLLVGAFGELRADYNCFNELERPRYEMWSNAISFINGMPSIDLEADYVPREFHDKTCEAMAERHQKEIEDMVSVVRCKECKRHNTHKCYMAFDLIATEDDDFCSYGEREGE